MCHMEEQQSYTVYMYSNKINGHKYIGYSNNPKRRFLDHWSAAINPKNKDHNSAFHRALQKYGRDDFDFTYLEENLLTQEEAKQREKYWIEYYNTYLSREHYNETPGGDAPGHNTIHIGEEHGMAELTEEEVKYCRQCYQRGLRSRDIYDKEFQEKITYSGFLRMWHGKTWKHIMPEVFKYNPHRAKYGEADRDIITQLFLESGLSLNQFQKTEECYVGYGTLWKMIYEPSFYDGK